MAVFQEIFINPTAFTDGISVYDANTEEMFEKTTGKNPAKFGL